jgi:predicted NAD-dependent protein-ADP-ribosyltransferase YbiA (DUF1768 family)
LTLSSPPLRSSDASSASWLLLLLLTLGQFALEARLVEHTANDSSWGDRGDGSGKNRLDQVLMSVCAERRRQAT